MESVASGRGLILSALVLLVCDIIGGFVALSSGADTFATTWGFDTETTVPLPIGVVQLLLAWLAARSPRPRVARIAAIVLSAFCLISFVFGSFDGDLIGNIESDGWASFEVVWAFVLLAVTLVVGLLAAVRARQL